MHRKKGRKEEFLKYIGIAATTLIVSFSTSCSDDGHQPLNPPGDKDKEVAEYTWAATADSLQDATYNTYLTSEGTFRQDNTGNEFFNYWWNAHMLDVFLDAYERTGDEAYIPKMKALLRGIKVKNGNKYQNVFVDDMQWLGISSLRAYGMTNDPEYLEVAVELWEEIKKNWSEVHGGGLTWKTDAPYGKNA